MKQTRLSAAPGLSSRSALLEVPPRAFRRFAAVRTASQLIARVGRTNAGLGGPVSDMATIDYAPELYDALAKVTREGTPSNWVVAALRAVRPEVRVAGFRRAVLKTVLWETLAEFFGSAARARLVQRRAARRFGKRRAYALLLDRTVVLEAWRKPQCPFIPDAYLIEPETRTVVCYEIEDSHPLNRLSLAAYVDAYWTLDQLEWTLGLVAYDIFGHPRILVLPEIGGYLDDQSRLGGARGRPTRA